MSLTASYVDASAPKNERTRLAGVSILSFGTLGLQSLAVLTGRGG